LPTPGTDAILHLLRVRHDALASLADEVLAQGLSDERRRALEERLDAAARADLTPEGADEVRAATLALVRGAKGAEQEGFAALFLVAAAPVPLHDNQLLRGLQAEALRSPSLPPDEEPLAVAVWADPLDRAALAAYERFLRAGAPTRADRVRRYLESIG